MKLKSEGYLKHKQIRLDFVVGPHSKKRNFVWCTDVHSEFCHGDIMNRWVEKVKAYQPAGLILSGDLGTAGSLGKFFEFLDEKFEFPTFFVLGNHDFYGGSIADVCNEVRKICESNKKLIYLDLSKPVALSENVGLIGHSGWADGKAGSGDQSPVELNDYVRIREFRDLNISERHRLMEKLSQISVQHIDKVLPAALDQFKRVIVVTHAPPFVEAAWYMGNPSEPDYLPHFSNPSLGEVIKKHALLYPKKKISVLCGHTHSGGVSQILPNLTVYAGTAEYRDPDIHGVITVA